MATPAASTIIQVKPINIDESNTSYGKLYKCFYKYERALLYSVGHDILDKNFKRHFYTFFIYVLTASFCLTNIYTFIAYDFFTMLNSMVFSCVSLEVCFSRFHIFELISGKNAEKEIERVFN